MACSSVVEPGKFTDLIPVKFEPTEFWLEEVGTSMNLSDSSDWTFSTFVSLSNLTGCSDYSSSSSSTSSQPTSDSDTNERLSPPILPSTSSPPKATPPKLPPCRVCGERASGFHYGVNTCEACKGFFRRSLQRKEEYKCIDNGNCVIEPGRRNFCPYCRYKKCQSLGMSKTAIKTGRYTHAKRTKDIQEVKRLERQVKMENSSLIHCDIESFHQEVIQALEKFRRENPFYAPEILERLEEIQSQYMNEYEYNKRLFDLHGYVSMSEYKEFYERTGIDIDGRRQMICWKIPQVEAALRKYVSFAKVIPGFKKLTLEDQIALIKVGRCEVLLLASSRGYSSKYDIVTGYSGRTHHLDELSRIYDGEYLKRAFQLARRLQSLNITDTELSLMQAIVIFFTDRCKLKQPDVVEDIQSLIARVLQREIEKSHPRNKYRFATLLNCLSDLRIIAEMHVETVKQVRVFVSDMDIEVPPLLNEMCS